MNGKQAKRARAAANAEAQRIGLWQKGEASLFSKWWRRLAARLFPRKRKQYLDAVGRWYKHVLKDFSRQAYSFIHDRDAQAMLRARERAMRKRRWAARKSRVVVHEDADRPALPVS